MSVVWPQESSRKKSGFRILSWKLCIFRIKGTIYQTFNVPEAARTQCSEPQPHRISRVFSCISGWGRPPRCRRISYKRTSRIISNRRAGVAKRFFVKRNGAELGGVQSFQAFQGLIKKPGGGNSNILLCSPGTLGTWSNLTSIFQMGLVQPPTRKICWPLGKPKGSLHRFHSPVSEWLTWLGRQKKKWCGVKYTPQDPPIGFCTNKGPWKGSCIMYLLKNCWMVKSWVIH